MAERECEHIGKSIQVGMTWMWWVPVFEAKESGDAGLVLLANDERIAIVRSEAVGDFGDAGFMLVGQRFEQAGLPHMGQLVHLSFDPQGESVVIDQPPQFRIVGQNDFRITVTRQCFAVSGIPRLVIAVALRCAELLQPSWGNTELEAFRNGLERGVA